MKWRKIFCLVLAMACLTTPAFGVSAAGDLVDELKNRQTELADGSVVSAWSTIESRYDRLGETFGAQVTLELWTTPAAGDDPSAENMVEQTAEGKDAITVFYAGGRAFVRIVSQERGNCDLSAVQSALTDPKAGDFDRLMGAWRALWTALADGAAIYPTAVTVEGSDVTSAQVEEALKPLREVFPGPVTVYYGRGEAAKGRAANVDSLHSPYEEDALLLCYEEATGAVGIYVGAVTGLKLTGEDRLPAAFAQAGPEGFAAGVEALAQNLHSMDEKSPWTIPLTAAGVGVIALGELWWRRKHPRA